MKRSEALGNKYFYLAFAVSFFVLSVMFLFLVSSVHPQSASVAAPEGEPQELEIYLPAREEAISVLFVGTQPGSATADCFILARFDPARGSVPVVVFPTGTMVQNGTKTETLSAVYQYGGADFAKNALAQTLGVTIDRYVHMNTEVFVACANTVGTIEYELQEELLIQQDGLALTLSPGIQLLDGKKVAAIITSRDYQGGELERCRVAGELTAAIVNQRIDVSKSALVDKMFEKIINLIDTDISYQDYESRKQAAEYLADKQEEVAVHIQVSGSFGEDGVAFTLSDTFVALIRQTLH